MNYSKILGVAGVVGSVAWAVWHLDLVQYASVDIIRGWVDSAGVFAPVIFMAVYIVATLLFISAAAFTVLAGALFGPVLGSTYVVVAATVAAGMAFFITRIAGKNLLHKLPEKGIGSLVHRLDRELGDSGFRSFLVLRCLFLPYAPLSYAAGLLPRAKTRDFILATLVTNAIFSPAFVFFGDALLAGPQALILPFGMIVLVLLVPRIVRTVQARIHR